ncbi:MAG: B12-binding domain-containing radical SAM protein [Gammaproteobacteria bacterium]|nr:B12-binding domain-containing radical SAM protein [Gammaproteobacteria bacterium]MDH5802913.1 B12-binding domain-containing radical SAM protein [Gammaproteobacteria bacterium]
MKLTLIKPNIGRMIDGPYVDEGRMEPLQLGVLAALTPADVEVVLHDDRMERIPYDEPTDLVAITVETYTAKRAYEICAEYRKRGVPIILGGFQPTLIPEECAPHADSLFIGDAELLWETVIEDARKGRLKPRYESKPGPPQPRVITRRDIFEGKGYLPMTLLQFSRGCRFTCDFCAISVFFDKTQYLRNIDEVVQEIQSQNRKLLFFVDDNICSNHEALKQLCRALIPLKVRWVSQGSIDMTKDRELMRLMVQSGCLGNVIGFESLDPDNLKTMKKAPNIKHFSRYREQIQILRDYGLQTWAAFTLGHDGDTLSSIEDTLDFALSNKFTFAAFNILVPYPNTPLYRKLESENRLLYNGKWWLHPDYRFNYATFEPKHMSPDELTHACHDARSRFNSVGSIVTRALDFKTNLRSIYRFGTYLQFNPIFRKEVFKKHGMLFGEC